MKRTPGLRERRAKRIETVIRESGALPAGSVAEADLVNRLLWLAEDFIREELASDT